MNKLKVQKIVCEARASSIPFKFNVKHNSSEQAFSQSIVVRIDNYLNSREIVKGYGESCPREYVTGETVSDAIRFIDSIKAQVMSDIHSIDDLRCWIDLNQSLIDKHPAGWCALELALLDSMARIKAQSVEHLLSLPSIQRSPYYTGVISDGSCAYFEYQIQRYSEYSISDIKLKLSGDLDKDKYRIDMIHQRLGNPSIRVDANNLFNTMDEALLAINQIKGEVYAIEEPLKSKSIVEAKRLAEETGTKIILDESFLSINDMRTHFESGVNNLIPNLRISKLGGLIRTLEIAAFSKANQIKTILGSQVGETSLLCRAGLCVANYLDRCLIAAEGAYGDHLLERDPFYPHLKFGKYGLINNFLRQRDLLSSKHGFGLACSGLG